MTGAPFPSIDCTEPVPRGLFANIDSRHARNQFASQAIGTLGFDLVTGRLEQDAAAGGSRLES
jgi:hypothetical protein